MEFGKWNLLENKFYTTPDIWIWNQEENELIKKFL